MSPTMPAIIPTEHSARIPDLMPDDVITTDPRRYVRDACMVAAVHEIDPAPAAPMDLHEWTLGTDEGSCCACVLGAHSTPGSASTDHAYTEAA